MYQSPSFFGTVDCVKQFINFYNSKIIVLITVKPFEFQWIFLLFLVKYRKQSEIKESVLTAFVLEEQTQKWTSLDTD